MNTTKEHALALIAGGAAAVALFAFVGAAGPGTPDTTVASGTVQLMDLATSAPLRVQDVDDDDSGPDEAALQQQNNAMQQMIQSEQQAEQQNEQAQQQALQDELQAQQTEQQANP
jgi:hypothetical protein